MKILVLRKLQTLLIATMPFFIFGLFNNSFAATVRIEGRQLLVDGYPFKAKGATYSPVPIGHDPETMPPYGDYFTSEYSSIYTRDLPLMRNMGANVVRVVGWNRSADHADFLNKAFNEGTSPIYVIVTFWMGPIIYPDISSSAARAQIKADFRSMVAALKNYPAILMWCIGNELNASWMYGNYMNDLFSLMDEMAAEAHAEEGAGYHPVTTTLMDSNIITLIAAYENSVTHIDVWSINVYRGISFGNLFNDYVSASSKPLLITEFGIDAYDHVRANEYELIGEPYQAIYASSLWAEIESNNEVCVGGTVMAYCDEWWKGKYSQDAGCPDYNPSMHSTCGYPTGSHPDGHANEEWWGIMRTVDNGTNPDIMQPRQIYSTLQSLWKDTDNDGIPDDGDNCPGNYNPLQEDAYPPQGNGIGDACECEGNFNCSEDQDVDGSDAFTFKADFGRSVILNPCIAEDPCNGDFLCDGDVDGTDASLFKSDFGRSAIQNPCPVCVPEIVWCHYQ